jgi:putative nucleotidyltransferase with HDIG domain
MLTSVSEATSTVLRPRARRSHPILIVDDETSVREVLSEGLSEYGLITVTVKSASEALRALEDQEFSLVLCDIHMPGEDGLQLLERIRQDYEDLDVVMVTGVTDVGVAVQSIRRGASDYLTKPFNLEEVWITIERTLEKRRLIRENRDYQERLEQKVQERTAERLGKNQEVRRLYTKLRTSYQETLQALAAALETRDTTTRGHCLRVAAYTAHIARRMGITGQQLTDIRIGALLHDVGKIGVPDSVLQKPGPLNPDEWEMMKQHPALGANLLEGIQFLEGAIPIVLNHQERFDGTGYPHGYRGDEIPIGARIFAVVDCFDSMTSDRPYRKALGYDDALREIQDHSGTQFDPAIVEEFVSIRPQDWKKIRQRIARGFDPRDDDDFSELPL